MAVRAETVVLVPVKSFDLAKGRMADALSLAERSDLARRLAAKVVKAAQPLPTFVVCDDSDVAAWALTVGANVLWVSAPGLSPAITEAVNAATIDGYRRAVISHADLPLAEDLTWLANKPRPSEVTIVPDRHGTGTNVLALPIGSDPTFTFHYGPGSAALHQHEAQRLGWSVTVVNDDKLGWDLDTPEDLEALHKHASGATTKGLL